MDGGSIDTVVMAPVDMQGRLQGKRFHGRYFVDEVLAHGSDASNYLLAVDVDTNPVQGHLLETGYGEFAMRPELATLPGCRGIRALRYCSPTRSSWPAGPTCPLPGRSSASRSTGWPAMR